MDDAIPAQVVVLRRESEAIDLVAEPRELDDQVDLIQRHRLTVERRPRVILRRYAAFEDRELDRKRPVDQHAAAVRAARDF